jgi:transcriptional regulator with XRE-family HTH domain
MVGTPNTKNVIGPQVRRFREQRGWSQSVLAAKCQMAGWDISRGIVAAVEGQVRWVGDFELMRLAKILRVQPTDLLPKKLDWSEFAERKN